MMRRAGWVREARAGVLLLAVLLVSCSESNWAWLTGKDKELPPEPTPKPLAERDLVRADSVGELSLVSGSAMMQIKGFGLVVGLNGKGSRDCASSIRTYLIDRMQKLMTSDVWSRDMPKLAVADLIDSPDTAVVELSAFVPVGATRGMHMDVSVTAATGTQTQSLEGGLLLPSELKVFGPASSGRGVLAGRTLGYARGPIFTSPYVSSGDTVAGTDPRRGYVLGGGVMTERRPARLILKQPSYPLARRIQQRLNETFGHATPLVAEAMSQAYIVFRTPHQYRAKPNDALQLASCVYLPHTPAFIDTKLRELAEAAANPATDYQAVSLAWQGI
ncbi:MAG: flagellar basal body P-ring protein FlgI, partial [Phycisphaerae bacterium]|nr:flagellar basal body P-ring protein FlgI [Phycisphaerae bacterium]